MIIAKIIGGLGNQMFQYAMARRLAYINNTELKLDLSGFDKYKLHDYSLCHYNIIETKATKEEIDKYKNNKSPINRVKYLLGLQKNNIVEKYFNFDPRILKLKDNIYLSGYWQSEKYFVDIKHIILKEFTVKSKIDKINIKIAERIKEQNSVSVHIRRMDYITDNANVEYHGIYSLDYYYKTCMEIARKISNPIFYIFSDDPGWCKENIKLDHSMVIINHNDRIKNYQDLWLMILCKHNIITNSTFGWWGAWLNKNKDKIIYAPEKWLNVKNINQSDIIPNNWIKIFN